MRNALRAAALLLALTLSLGTLVALPAPEKTPADKVGAPEKMQTATGNVSKLQASERAVTVALADGPQTRFLWTKDTRINGTLAVGAKVTIRFTTLPDGQNIARQISVSKG